MTRAVLLVGETNVTDVRIGHGSPDAAAEHRDIQAADRVGWAAVIDLRGVHGQRVRLTLVARTFRGDWVEVAGTELRLEQPAS